MKRKGCLILFLLIVGFLVFSFFIAPELVAETTYRVDHTVLTGVSDFEKYQHCQTAMEAGRRVSNSCYELIQQFGK